MPRTSSQTLYYWQADVGMFDDPKIVDLNDEYGPLGEAILFRIFDYIARTDGYFAQLNDALIIYLYRSVGNKWIKNKRIISEIIQFCGVCGLFDVNLLTQNVITSQGIQRRWLYAKKKDRARGFSTAKYWLLGEISNEPLQGRPRKKSDSCNNNADNCSNNADNCDNNSPYKKRQENIPPLSPKGGSGGEWEEARARFFSAYPKLKGLARLDDSKIDYNLLYKRFAESEFLRTRYVAMWVYRNYEAITQGTWRDEESAEEQTHRRTEWYRKRRERAEDIAEYWQKKAETIPGYCDLMKQKKTLEIASAKAAAEGTSEKVQEAERALGQTVIKIHNLLKQNGIKKADLSPKFKCAKCDDTGFLPDGRACDCYEKEKENVKNQ